MGPSSFDRKLRVTRRQCLTAAAAASAGLLSSSAANAAPPALTPAEQTAVDQMLAIVRGAQLPDGGIVQVNHGAAPSSPVWVAPYFANHCALALLANYERFWNALDLWRVRNWLLWLSSRQHPVGYWFDQVGTRARYASNGFVDAWDSSAAMYLAVVGKYQALGGPVHPAMVRSAERALACIRLTTDVDGLTWAKPTYRVKFLLDQIEVHAGLRAAATFFRQRRDMARSNLAALQAAQIAALLPSYWRPAQNLFAWALHPNGAFDVGLSTIYPEGLAQLFGVAFVQTEAAAWNATLTSFAPQTDSAAAAGVERFLSAASQIGGVDEAYWRNEMVVASGGFTTTNVYSYRPAVGILGLLQRADWFPRP